MDYGHAYTNNEIKKLEREIHSVYKEAESDILRKINDFERRYKIKEQIHLQELQDGEITQEQFDNWKKGQVFQRKQWKAKRESVLDTMHNANKIAADIVNGKMENVFAVNANYMSYSMEHETGINFGFGIYDSATVSKLIKENPQLLPKWKIDEEKDYIWSKKKLNRSITQGIIQGESLETIAKRLSKKLVSTNESKMKTFARTAMTEAQNAGRLQSMKDAQDLGIELEKQWMATLDLHTRKSHANVDGESVPLNGKFSNGLKYPGQPGGAPAEVYNCRCTMVSNIKKYPAEYERYDNIDGKPIKNMTYKEWIKTKEPKKFAVVNGKDISATWRRRPDEFDFEIDDIINAQGFDGLPKVVSADEFDRYAQESNFIAQRTYSAPNQETLDAYRQQLYEGKWYVDCSTGGAAFGQGMYGFYSNNVEVTDGIRKGIEYYSSKYAGKSVAIETFTMDKSAKLISYAEISKIAENIPDKESIWGTMDEGVAAALKGYDGIIAKNNEVIILNRTKVIFKRGK